MTPLDQADGKVHFEAYSFKMEKLEDKNTGNKRGKTPFHVAAKRGKLSDCKLRIKSIDNNIPSDKYGITHFYIAAELGHLPTHN